MRKNLTGMLCFLLALSCGEKKTEPTSNSAVKEEPAQAVFADAKFTALGEKGINSLSSGDLTDWNNGFAENAVYYWNNGDSIKGKTAINEYWTKRRKEVIDTMTFSNRIWLPITVNKPQANERTGNYLLCWYRVDATYKTGKKMGQFIHTVLHFDANDKIDFVSQYLDRVPINAAMAK
jgi:hypothetical protein